MTKPTVHRLVILDDYQSLAAPHFTSLAHSITTTTFNDTILPTTPERLSTLTARLHPFTIISTMRERTPFPAALIDRLPNLKLLLTTGPRNAAIDLDACAAHGILVAGTRGVPPPPGNPRYPKPDSTTTHTWALILALSRHLARDHDAVVCGGWQGATLCTPLSGRTLGLVGLGRLGSAVGRIAVQGWGMRVVAWSPHLTQARADAQATAAGLEAGDFEAVEREDVFAADVVSVHMVLSEGTRGLVRERELRSMRREALFVNTSRGPIVDEGTLLQVAREGRVAGVALDVFDTEPLPEDSAWRREEWGKDGRAEVLLSPHTGYAETGVLNGWYRENAENLRRWLNGEEVSARL